MLNREILKMDTTLLRPALEIRSVELHTPFSWLRAGLDDLRAAPFHTVTRRCACDGPGLVARRGFSTIRPLVK